MTSPMSLLDLQRRMQGAVQNGFSNDAHDLLVVGDKIRSARERIQVYEDAYRIRMISSVCDDFTRVGSALEREDFESLAWEFILENPSMVRNLAEYGEGMSGFLKSKRPELFEHAVLDWMEILSRHASEEIDRATPHEIESGIQFVLAVSPATMIYEDSRKVVVLSRINDEVEETLLTQQQATFLSIFKENKSLAELEAVAAQEGMRVDEVAEIIAVWLSRGILYCRKLKINFS